ncbi:hypothetical protein CU102_08425 [Phyllobacterium brassicacearum]|uniref:Uncharacterized protein n=1 Tax=Phyllobacterium brassicacearum TaxID=314235 RepID=A0A2P7BSG6_9HYPH|nr:hypothetical protein [Phyllobacterium brassicacearum]PSH69399.1 hypothetical protein CU102_08425 [Phyllobacterium brassicacearum]TDQ34427.1 hypothetical protein DEV91_103159 [Phyllobacterium brassicacearum]
MVEPTQLTMDEYAILKRAMNSPSKWLVFTDQYMETVKSLAHVGLLEITRESTGQVKDGYVVWQMKCRLGLPRWAHEAVERAQKEQPQ